jgi:hypothetical protein
MGKMAEQISLIEQELKKEEEVKVKEEKKAKKEKRTLNLIADFNKVENMKGLFAEGWYFSLPESFKDELDIKYMERKEKVLDKDGKQVVEEVKDKSGKIKKKKNPNLL